MNWLWTWVGARGSGSVYAVESGFLGLLPEIAIFGLVWRRVNCHAKGCWRVGLHKVSGTHYVTCRRDHPVHDGSTPATTEQIAQAHRDAQQQLR